jgi:murein DD-endopeptidase MepM/ murein hydrolase activator NlpD
LAGWVKTGTFLEDYSKVPNATVDKHLGEDWVYRDEQGKNITDGQAVSSFTSGTATVGTDSVLGEYVRVTATDGQRTDYFHLQETDIQNGAQVQTGDTIGLAGHSGGVTSHLHVAQSYPDGKGPEGVDSHKANGRSYVDPPDMVNPAPSTGVAENSNQQSNKKTD